MSDRPPSSLLPVLVLGAILAAAVLMWWGFPRLQAWVAGQDCVATGRTNCG